VTRFLALGDSYTIGEGVEERDRWPNQVINLLRTHGITIGDFHIIARTAWTTDELSDAIDQAALKGAFDLVTLMIGVNDQYRSRPVASFRSGFQELLTTAIAFAANTPKRVIAISIPDWGATPFADGRDRSLIGAEIQAYNDAARSMAERRGVRWVDVTEPSRAMLTDSSLVAVDGLHPTGAMYARWAELIAPIALEVLRAPSR
jgi:lysophospholipase L1-like esterase